MISLASDTPVEWGHAVVTETGNRLIGTSGSPRAVTVNLGKLPAGEVIFAVGGWKLGTTAVAGPGGQRRVTHDGGGGYVFKAGPADRNPDQVAHALVQPLPGGVLEVSFEDTFGTPRELKADFYTDVVLRVKGVSMSDPDELAAASEALGQAASDASLPKKVRDAAYALKNGDQVGRR